MGAAGGGGKLSWWKIIARICAEILILGDSRLLAFQYDHIYGYYNHVRHN